MTSIDSLKAKFFTLGLNSTELTENGYQLLRGSEWPIPTSLAHCWKTLAHSWSDLPVDPYLKNGATFRQRRIGHFTYKTINAHIAPSSNTQFFQSKTINDYAGGIDRNFAPLHDLTYHNKLLHYIIANSLEHFCTALNTYHDTWSICLHQFRITADSNTWGLPTPEGVHRDGHKFISMHMINRMNVEGGISSIYNNENKKLADITLEQPLDSLFVMDEWRKHSVSPIQAKNPALPAYRDMLVIDYNLNK